VRRYLVDTHVLLWWLGGQSKRLGRAARRAVEAAGAGGVELFISVVSLWEVALLHDEGSIRLSAGFSAWCDAVEATPGLGVVPLLRADVEAARMLGTLRDPHGRLIAGTALRLSVPLISADRRMRSSAVRVLWDR